MKPTDFRLNKYNTVQFLEYLVGGGVYFWSGYLVFAALYSGAHWDWVPAKIAADVVGWSLNYLIQRYWTFNNPRLRQHEAQVAGKYALLTVFNLALDYCIIWSLKSLGVSPYVAFFISAGFFTVWNYLWYRFWVFFQARNTNYIGGVRHG